MFNKSILVLIAIVYLVQSTPLEEDYDEISSPKEMFRKDDETDRVECCTAWTMFRKCCTYGYKCCRTMPKYKCYSSLKPCLPYMKSFNQVFNPVGRQCGHEGYLCAAYPA